MERNAFYFMATKDLFGKVNEHIEAYPTQNKSYEEID